VGCRLRLNRPMSCGVVWNEAPRWAQSRNTLPCEHWARGSGRAVGTLLRLGVPEEVAWQRASMARAADRYLIPTNSGCGFPQRIAGWRLPPTRRGDRQPDNALFCPAAGLLMRSARTQTNLVAGARFGAIQSGSSASITRTYGQLRDPKAPRIPMACGNGFLMPGEN
jgi:hypothetical protein